MKDQQLPDLLFGRLSECRATFTTPQGTVLGMSEVKFDSSSKARLQDLFERCRRGEAPLTADNSLLRAFVMMTTEAVWQTILAAAEQEQARFAVSGVFVAVVEDLSGAASRVEFGFERIDLCFTLLKACNFQGEIEAREVDLQLQSGDLYFRLVQ